MPAYHFTIGADDENVLAVGNLGRASGFLQIPLGSVMRPDSPGAGTFGKAPGFCAR